LKSGSTVEWPADTQAGNGNAGVAQIVSQTNGAVGYVDLSDAVASKLTYASVKNSAGNYIVPSAESATAAAGGVTPNPDLTLKSVNSPAPQGYPITAPTYVIIYQSQSDAGTGNHVNYLITTGQKLLPDLDYASLPQTLQSMAVAQLDQIKVG
jgi:phosphate transport system substrate-binding protein